MAFREHASGLLVPEEVSRERQVWTKDEWKAINRVTTLLESRGMRLQFTCDAPVTEAAALAEQLNAAARAGDPAR